MVNMILTYTECVKKYGNKYNFQKKIEQGELV